MSRQDHWENVYTTKRHDEVSWYQVEAGVSMELICAASPQHGRVVDVGGGASVLAEQLLDANFAKVAVLDIAPTALAHARRRLGPQAARIAWIHADVADTTAIGEFDVWHDRAVFHFLTEPQDRQKYVQLALRTLPVGGHLIMGTFATDGPSKCSGLEVCRYDGPLLTRELGAAFRLVRETRHTHLTPQGKPQNFFFGVFQRL